ncbi:MAG: tetratricopeptide repeat protein [Candidatus Saliniplasma sp.]
MSNLKTSQHFVDRKDILQAFKKILDEGGKGRPYTIFVSGEPGIGKTSLIEEISKIASSEGYLLLKGVCKFNESTPYNPFCQAFSDLDGISLRDSVDQQEMGRLRDKNMLDAYRNAYFFQTCKRLREISTDQPVILILDDIHWADRGSLNLFHYLADRIDESEVLLIGCYCPGDAIPGGAFLDMKQQMSRKDLYTEFDLSPFDIDDTHDMIKTILDVEKVPVDLAKKVHEVTQGNPLFIKESMLQMQEEGYTTDDELFTEDIGQFELPLLMQNVVERRVSRLDGDARQVLQICSVIGERIPYRLLKSLFQKDEMQLLDAIDELTLNRLLMEDDENEHLYFSHNLIKDIVYNGIGKWLERKRLHFKVAEAMRSFYIKDKKLNYHVLGSHYLKADRFDRSLEYFLRAGEVAEKMYSHEDAVEMYKKVLSVAERVDEGDIDLVRIYEKIARAYSLLGEYEDARDYLHDALVVTTNYERKQKIYSEISMNWEEQGEYEKALEIVERGLELDDKDSKSKSHLLDKKGWIFLRRSQYQEAKDIFKKEIDTAEKIRDSDAIAQAYHNFGTLSMYIKDYENAEKYLKKAEEIRKEEEILKELTKTLNNLGMLFESIDIDRTLQYYNEALEINEKVGDISMKNALLNNIGRVYYHKAELYKAIKTHIESYENKERTGDKYGISLSLVNLGLIHAEKGAFDEAHYYHQRSLEIVEELGENFCRAINLRGLGYISKLKGDLDDAQDYYQRSLEASKECGDKAQTAETYAALGEIYLERGSAGKSEKVCKKALEICKEIKSVRERALAHRTLGRVYWEEGYEEKALTELEKAGSLLKESGFDLELAKTRLYLGKFLDKMGEKNSEKYIDQAMEVFERSDMEPWLNLSS